LSASNPAALDVEAAGIVRAPSASPLNILHVLRAPLGGLFRHVVDLVQDQAARRGRLRWWNRRSGRPDVRACGALKVNRASAAPLAP